MLNFYRVLGIGESAGPDEVKSAYRRLARQYHPDLSLVPSESDFRRVREAYETLSDEDRRRAYDQALASARRASRRERTERRWFSDEIAIDFPSVASVVDRIFDAFLGEERPAPLTAELQLSAAEAFHGVTVPMDVPLRSTCVVCGGRGEVWGEWCRECEGRGELVVLHRVTVSVPARIAHGSRFSFSCGTHQAPPTRVEIRVAIR